MRSTSPSPSHILLLSILAVCCLLVHVHARIPPNQRKFTSSAVEQVINSIAPRIKDSQLATIFTNSFPNTLDTTVYNYTHISTSTSASNTIPYSFIITGDIEAQWMRDSTNQVLPYMDLIPQDPKLQDMICGLLNRQIDDVVHDPFANAFNQFQEGGGNQQDQRVPPMTPHVFEGKYELDSLAAVLKLSFHFLNTSTNSSCVNANQWHVAMRTIIKTITTMQAATSEDFANPPYKFNRVTNVATDTLGMQSRGAVCARCGLSKCMFRPSDDANTLPFSIPSNAMASVELFHLASIANRSETPFYDAVLASDAFALASEIKDAIWTHGVFNHPVFGNMFAYEVDCFGSAIFMDDANTPSLLSLPFLGFVDASDPVYQNTRKFVLSPHNPYFFSGKAGEGTGGPHVGYYFVWPMSIITRALTSDSDTEISQCLTTLRNTTANTFFMHESFYADDASNFTRTWFAWANGLFGELIRYLADHKPHLIF